jgi:hypothetical protein
VATGKTNILCMKNSLRTYLLFISLIALAASCGTKNYVQEEGFCTATPDGDSVLFEYNKPVSLFTVCKDNVQATITQVSDSRCPEGVVCVWAGKLNVVLKMDSLTLNLEKDKVIDTVYHDNRYTFNLVNVLPMPTSQGAAKPEQQRIYINIMRANRSRPVEPGNTLPIASDSTAKPKA